MSPDPPPPARRAELARRVLLVAAIATLAEVLVSGWLPGVVLALGLWAGVLVVLAQLPARVPTLAAWLIAPLAVWSWLGVVNWLRLPAEEHILIPAFAAHVGFSVLHAALLSVAAIYTAGPRLAGRWRRYWDRPGDASLAGPRLVAGGLATWTVALLLLLAEFFRPWPAVGLAPLLCAAGALCFAAVRRVRRRHRRLAGLAIWVTACTYVLLVIAVDFAFRGGANQDPPDKPGIANLAIDLLDEGAGDLDSSAFKDRLERKAIDLSFNTGRDFVRGTLRTLKENRDEAFNLLRLALTAPRFDAVAVERVRAQTISRLQRQTQSPNDIASKNWWETAFPGHAYGRPVIGSLESVPRISTDDLKAYTRRVLARDSLKIAVVGDIDVESAGRLIDSTFGTLPAKAELRTVPDATPQGLGRRIVVELDVPQASVTFGGAGIARHDPDFMAAFIVNHILGGGSFSSRLYKEVREKRGLAYGVFDTLVWLNHAAVLIGGTGTRNEATGEAIQVIEDEFRLMAKEGPTAEELTKAKTYLKGSFALGLDTSSKIANQLVQMQLDNLGIDYIERRPALIDAVTLEDTKRVAKRLLDPGMLVTVTGRPKGITSKGPAE